MMRRSVSSRTLTKTLSAMVLAASAAAFADHHDDRAQKMAQGGAKRAEAMLQARTGSTIAGKVVFTPAGPGMVRVVAEVSGATPGPHGFHVHETGDCSDAEFKAAGGHFNPHGAPHAGPDSNPRHAGDLGNLIVRPDGTGRLDGRSSDLSLAPGPNSVIGKAVIFHEAIDDYTTQPTGNAGGRLACGVVVAIP
jgi:Cu-Zn family superoxide dismutase